VSTIHKIVRDELGVPSAFLAVAEERSSYAGGKTAGRVSLCLSHARRGLERRSLEDAEGIRDCRSPGIITRRQKHFSILLEQIPGHRVATAGGRKQSQ
jgi:hypothetical protein